MPLINHSWRRNIENEMLESATRHAYLEIMRYKANAAVTPKGRQRERERDREKERAQDENKYN